MRRVDVSEFVSLDGFMADPSGAEGFGQGGWPSRLTADSRGPGMDGGIGDAIDDALG